MRRAEGIPMVGRAATMAVGMDEAHEAGPTAARGLPHCSPLPALCAGGWHSTQRAARKAGHPGGIYKARCDAHLAVLEAYVVESTVESERHVLAVAVGQCVCSDRILLRIVVEGVLATARYRDGPGQVIGSLKVDQVVATGVLEHVEPVSPPRVVVEAR